MTPEETLRWVHPMVQLLAGMPMNDAIDVIASLIVTVAKTADEADPYPIIAEIGKRAVEGVETATALPWPKNHAN